MAGSEYLLEVRVEEIPARMLAPAVAELAERVGGELAARELQAEIETAFTPRRLVLVARGLPAREPDREEQVTGPPASVGFDAEGKPTKAALGFAARCGVAPEALSRVETGKGEYLAATVRTEGRPAGQVLAEIVPRALTGLSWPKTMRWGSGEGPWIRPVHGVVSLLDGEVVPFALFGVAAGAETVGHPVLSPERFAVEGAADHRTKLADRGIEISPAARRDALVTAMRKAAADLGGELVEDAALLDKLTAICEIPGVLVGDFDRAFLGLPREVLITSLRDHQSALTVEEPAPGGEEPEEAEKPAAKKAAKKGAKTAKKKEAKAPRAAAVHPGDPAAAGPRPLLPHFLTVMDRADDPAGRVKAGNEWVVAARLADARFFYDEDRKVPLAERAGRLDHLTFHERLGSYAEKSARIGELTSILVEELGWQDEADDAVAAAALLKADLASEMVKEFTSLQGVVGGLYAREEGAPEAVWQAIYDQYLPASSDDPLPRGRVGKLTALADRIDTLVGIFGLGLVPTGSRDPFGLRRAAQGAVRIALGGELPLDLDLVAARAALLYGDRLERSADEVLEALRPFLHDRIRYLLGLAGYAYDEIEAALAVGGSHLPDLKARVDALHQVREEEAFLSVVLAAKRIVNIVKDHPEYPLEEEALVEEAERDLHRAFGELRADVEEAAAAHEYERALRRIADLAQVLDRFFVEVLVMDEDRRLRRNRIALLQAIQRVISKSARLTEVVVDRAEHRARFGAAAETAGEVAEEPAN